MFFDKIRRYSHQATATSVTSRIFSRAFPSPTIFCLPYIGLVLLLLKIPLCWIQVEPLLPSSINIGQSILQLETILALPLHTRCTNLAFGKISLPSIFSL